MYVSFSVDFIVTLPSEETEIFSSVLLLAIVPVAGSIEIALEFSLDIRNLHFKVGSDSSDISSTFGVSSCFTHFPSLKSCLEIMIDGASVVFISP